MVIALALLERATITAQVLLLLVSIQFRFDISLIKQGKVNACDRLTLMNFSRFTRNDTFIKNKANMGGGSIPQCKQV